MVQRQVSWRDFFLNFIRIYKDDLLHFIMDIATITAETNVRREYVIIKRG